MPRSNAPLGLPLHPAFIIPFVFGILHTLLRNGGPQLFCNQFVAHSFHRDRGVHCTPFENRQFAQIRAWQKREEEGGRAKNRRVELVEF